MKKILIVEDDRIVANIYSNKFSVEGYRVEVAHDGHAGLEALRRFRPDAVVLDLMLPRLTGVELLKKVRAEPEFEKLPIIVFSNTYLTNMVQDAWKAGATKCLSKASCSPKQLVEVVRSTLMTNGDSVGQAAASDPVRTSNQSSEAGSAPPYRSASDNDRDFEFQEGLRKPFLQGLPAILTALRASLQTLIKTDDQEERLKHLHEMYRRMHSLTSNAGITGLLQIAQMADALEALLKELFEKPKNINASTLRTLAASIDFVGHLITRGFQPEERETPVTNILVVDDEAISRRAITYALEKAKLKSVSIEDPLSACNLLAENKFDLIFLDVDMPGMNGFELCTKLRTLPAHKKTPVVFVTGLNDFESRTHSMVSGGNDFIAKPFLFIELAVKALVYVMRGRLERQP
jgi:DNA-binding response OmpR family regulator